MNRLSQEKQNMILSLMVEGNSIRGIERLTGVHRDTIMRLMVRVGEHCSEMLDKKMRFIHAESVQVDEIWTYVYKRKTHLTMADLGTDHGDQFVFVAIDADSKLIPCFSVGRRTEENAFDFVHELQQRVVGPFQLTTDGFVGYRNIDTVGFRRRIDYAILVKKFGKAPSDPSLESYSPRLLVRQEPSVICGTPDPKLISTSYVERQNLTIRTQIRRFTRLTNAFSKKLDNLRAALSVYFWSYNFQREHRSLKMTPAMAAGVRTSFLTWNVVL